MPRPVGCGSTREFTSPTIGRGSGVVAAGASEDSEDVEDMSP